MRSLSTKLRKARNFLSTALVLLKSFLKTTGWRGYISLIIASGMGLIQPVPLAFLAHIAMAASKALVCLGIRKTPSATFCMFSSP